jgi:type IV secretion system protein VirD4
MAIGTPEPERETAQAQLIGLFVGLFAGFVACFYLSWPLRMLFAGLPRCAHELACRYDRGVFNVPWVVTWFAAAKTYLVSDLWSDFQVWTTFLLTQQFVVPFSRPALQADIAWGVFVLATPAILFAVLIVKLDIPRRLMRSGSRWADARDLRDNGLFCRTGFVLGKWKGRLIRNWETLSLVLLAPAGTGKSAGFVIPQLLADWPDNAEIPAPCFVVNDPRGDILKRTGAYRASQGPVYVVNWGSLSGDSWNPLSPLNFSGGERIPGVRQGIVEAMGPVWTDPPSALAQMLRLMRDNSAAWRDLVVRQPEQLGTLKVPVEEAQAAIARDSQFFMRVEDLQGLYAKRETQINRYNAILIDEKVEAHWRDTGREFLSGATGFHMARCDREHAEALSRGETAPPEPSYARMLEWLNTPPPPEENEAPENEQDQTALLLDHAIKEAIKEGYPARVIQDLQSTRMKPDRERGSVISTATAGLAIFKTASIAARTATSSFSLSELRGSDKPPPNFQGRKLPKKPKRGWPVTVYFPIALEDADSFGRVTALFLEASGNFAMSQDEGEIKAKHRPLIYLLDEFWIFPRTEVAPKIPAFGRGVWVFAAFVGQSFAQLELRFGRELRKVIQEACGYFIFLAQNSDESAKEISDAIGTHKVVQRSASRHLGWFTHDRGPSENVNIADVPLIRPSEIKSLQKMDPTKGRKGEQIVVMTGMWSTPVKCAPAAMHIDRRGFRVARILKRAQLPWRGSSGAQANQNSAQRAA